MRTSTICEMPRRVNRLIRLRFRHREIIGPREFDPGESCWTGARGSCWKASLGIESWNNRHAEQQKGCNDDGFAGAAGHQHEDVHVVL